MNSLTTHEPAAVAGAHAAVGGIAGVAAAAGAATAVLDAAAVVAFVVVHGSDCYCWGCCYICCCCYGLDPGLTAVPDHHHMWEVVGGAWCDDGGCDHYYCHNEAQQLTCMHQVCSYVDQFTYVCTMLLKGKVQC